MITTIATIIIIVIAFAFLFADIEEPTELKNIKTAVHMYKARLHIAQVQLKRRLEDISEDNS